MVKSIGLFCLIVVNNLMVNAQETLYDYVKLGDYQVGFFDTLLLDPTMRYEAYDYAGMKPNFIQVWHPVAEQETQEYSWRFCDFVETKTYEGLETIQTQLKKQLEESIIRDCIEENLDSGDENNFGSYSYTDVLYLMGQLATKSSFHNMSDSSQFPIIIYHHGSQSGSFENVAMAEYFASRGFIFVSSNFHLPYENTPFGLKPYAQLVKGEEEQSLKNVVRFAQTLSNSTSIFFIGHSWGAQMGIRTFDQDTTIKGLVSLETTLEFQTDTEKIQDRWPEVYQKVITDHAEYPFPILLCAATGEEKPFVFFENMYAQHITFAPTKETFEHNAYTSIFYLRYFIDAKVVQTDKEKLKNSLLLYVKHLELIREFIEGILQNEKKARQEIRFVHE